MGAHESTPRQGMGAAAAAPADFANAELVAADVVTRALAGDSQPERHSGMGCFLCVYGDGLCDVPRLDGTLLGVVERWRGGDRPVLLVATPTGERVAVVLEPRDRPLARALERLAPERRQTLHLRVYHLRGHPPASTSGGAGAGGAGAGGAGADVVPDVAGSQAGDTQAGDTQAGDTQAGGRGRVRTLRATAASAVVLEPDLLLNITDINHAEYCVRQYVLRRVVPSPPNAATLRGTIIHGAFKELLKGRAEDPDVLLEQALRAQAADLALHDLPADAIEADAKPHLRALVRWYDTERQGLWRSAPHIRVETFVLAPDVGLKGRLDALWEDEHTSRLLELKTSTVRGDLPRREHRWQVYGYQTLLAARRAHRHERHPAATLLYSGTPGQAEGHTLPFSLRELHRVLELRNLLAIAHATGEVPDPPGEHKCARCAIHRDCARAAPLLGWTPPPVEDGPAPEAGADAAWFGHYYDLLAREGRAAEELARALWTTTPAERREAGTALTNLEPLGEPRLTARGEWEYTFGCANESELRDGDPILLSDGDPIHGAAVTGTLLRVTDREVVVWTPERIAAPRLIDRYAADIVHDRTVRNLWRWLDADPRLRALARGELAPSFAENAGTVAGPEAPGRADFNPGQRQAVARALAARDFALIQGPPGTGKTRVVAEIIQRAVARGERVLVAAFTNQAVDNVLRRLVAEGYHDFVRLGHRLSVADEIQPYRLAERAAEGTGRNSQRGWEEGRSEEEGARRGETERGPAVDPARLREMLAGAPVVASTTATWSSEHYDGAGAPLAFDLAVVDEASQLTVPALVGALRFARRFVLVGDERQLPPLVVSPEAAAGGLGRSLFAELLARWGAGASVALDQQYRMHPMICAFPSREFYDGHLVTAGSARDAALAIAAEERPAAPFDPARPVVFLDVGGEARTSRPSGAPGGEKASRAQAEVAARVVLGLRARGVDAAGIGVVAPYRAQVAAIRQRLAAAGETGVVVDTVDRFQGGEREVVVLAFGPDPLRMAHRAGAMVGTIAGATPFVADAHRLNVALTRARSKLILIGDRAALARVPVLGRLVEYCAGLYGGRGGIARVGDARVNDPEGTGNGSQRGREERREEEDREREAPRGPGGARVRR